jgi:tetratricopeptide (TPR) repeat protein
MILTKKVSGEERICLCRQFISTIKNNFRGMSEYAPLLAEYYGVCNDEKKALYYSLQAAELSEKEYDYGKSVEFLQKAAAYAEKIEPDKVASLLLKIGILEYNQGNMERASSAYLKGLEHTNAASPKVELYYNLGLADQKKGRFNDAIECFQNAIRLASEENRNYVNILNNLSYSMMSSGRLTEAHALLEKSLAITEKESDDELRVKTLYLKGVLELTYRRYDDGIKTVRKALEIAEANNYISSAAKCYNLLGSLFLQQGDFAEAEKAYGSAVQMLQSSKDFNALAAALANSALVITGLNKQEKAIQLLETALSHARKIGNNRIEASVLVNLANIHEAKSDMNKAIALYKQAMFVDSAATKPIYNLFMIYFKIGEVDKAKELIEHGLKAADQ